LKIGSLESEIYQRVLRIREIGLVQVHIGTKHFPWKNLRNVIVYLVSVVKLLIVVLHGISEMIMMNRQGCCLHCAYQFWTLIEATIQLS